MKEFQCRTKIISGTGAVAALKDMKAKRLFLVTDPFFVKNGTAARIAQNSGAEWRLFLCPGITCCGSDRLLLLYIYR